MLQFTHVGKRYPSGYEALKAVSFTLDDGEMAFLTGHSGAGKSTLLKLIALIERPTRGQLIVNGRNLQRFPARRIPHYRRDIGVVFQDNRLLFDRTVYDNIALPLHVTGTAPAEIPKRVRAALDKVGLLEKEKLNPIVLSGGEQQRIGIARAIVHRPSILLADEPTGNLDPDLSLEILNLFLDFHDHGTTVIIATHDMNLLRVAKKRVLQLNHGELMLDTGARE